MAPIPSKTHTAGEAFGWQMPPRGQSKMASRNKQLRGTEVQAVRKDVQNTLNGIVVKTLQCWAFVWECGTSWISYMSDSCSSLSPPGGLRIRMLGLPRNQRVVSYSKIAKIIHLYRCQWNTDRFLFKKSDVMKNCKVPLWHDACIKATAFARMVTTCARTVARFKSEGLLAYDLHLQ